VAVGIFDHPSWRKPMLPLREADMPDAPRPGFFLLRTPARFNEATGTTQRGRWIIPALIYRPCPWVQPDELPLAPGAAGPEQWCMPSDRPRPLRAQIGGVDREEGVSWGDRCSAAQQVWEWGRRITAAQYEDALRKYADYQLR